MRAVGAAWATMTSFTRSSTNSTVAFWIAFKALSVSSSGSPGPAPTRLQVPRDVKECWVMAGSRGELDLTDQTQDMFHLHCNRCRHFAAASQHLADVGGGGGRIGVLRQAGQCQQRAALRFLQAVALAGDETVHLRHAARI